ncbi:FAD-binding oxidoreductase [Streptomyces sp. JB150]|uniref:FAD-binding oxidoreductase n=1 Tax=Streptomyces sp. JB150 TaxID=2714844 RepID=UPI00140CE498|nr:FAD-binding oxidoreductase [Streptomyces sp. JB150]QIJ62668.1 FAD-binding oxidoreductase [Streptomyces sp. JB150]
MNLPGTTDLLLLRPGDAGYAEETAGFQTGFVRRPAVVLGARSAGDVAAAVRYAAARDLPLAVQATGHGVPGPLEGGVLVTTRRMDRVAVDPAARTARIEAGVRWGEVVAAAAPYGLAPPNGSATSVGAVGYTLGGGLGILARAAGHAADRVRSLDVVTGDGRTHRAVREGSELYWGLLGGGPGLGIVTAMEIELVPVGRLYGGSLAFDGRRVDPAAVLAAYEAWTWTVPDELTSSFAAVPYPDLPALPPGLRGRYVVSVRVAYPGTDGERLVAPLREIGPVLADSLREMPYAESRTIHSDPEVPHAYYGDSVVLGRLDVDRVAEVLRRTGPAADGADPMVVVQINHLGGALARPAPNAVPFREGRFLLRLLTAGDRQRARALLDPAFARLTPDVLGRAVNFAFGAGDRTEGLHEPGTRKRLAGLRSSYDPANLFRSV